MLYELPWGCRSRVAPGTPHLIMLLRAQFARVLVRGMYSIAYWLSLLKTSPTAGTVVVSAAMRSERRGFPLDGALLGHGRCGGRGLVPLDPLRLARHRAGEHLVHARDRNDIEAL